MESRQWRWVPAVFVLVGFGIGCGLVTPVVAGWMVADPDNLDSRDIYDRVMEDRSDHDLVMESIESAAVWPAAGVALVFLCAAAGWFLKCWRTPIATIGAARRLRGWWLWLLLCGLAGALVGCAISFFVSDLSSWITDGALLELFALLLLCLGAAYYVATALGTPAVYRPAIPGSRYLSK